MNDYEKEIARLQREKYKALCLIIIGVVFIVISLFELSFFIEVAKIYK